MSEIHNILICDDQIIVHETLRQKLVGDNMKWSIKSIYGVGYKFELKP